MNVSKENIDDLNAVVKLTVEKKDYEDRVNGVLKDYRKKANIPGFRPGKVPMGMVKKMYGNHVLAEQVNTIVSEEISKYLYESKLNVLGEPLPSDAQETIDFEKQDDFTFSFDVAIAPEFEVKLSKEEKLPYYTIEITDEALEAQVKNATASFATSEKLETADDTSLVKGDMIQLNQDGNVFEEGIKADDTIVSVEKLKTKKAKGIFGGSKVDDVLVFNPKTSLNTVDDLAFLLKISKEEAEKVKGEFQFTIKEITKYQDPELNQDLFDQILGKDIATTEAEFTAKIKEDLQKSLGFESDYKFSLDVKNELMKKIDISLPEVFLKRWILTINHDNEQFNAETIDEDMPKYIEDLKWQLIKNEIIKGNDIKVEESDIIETAKKSAKMQFMQYGLSSIPDEHIENYAKDMLKQEEQRRNMSETAVQEKVMAFIKEAIEIEEKELSREEFNKLFEE